MAKKPTPLTDLSLPLDLMADEEYSQQHALLQKLVASRESVQRELDQQDFQPRPEKHLSRAASALLADDTAAADAAVATLLGEADSANGEPARRRELHAKLESHRRAVRTQEQRLSQLRLNASARICNQHSGHYAELCHKMIAAIRAASEAVNAVAAVRDRLEQGAVATSYLPQVYAPRFLRSDLPNNDPSQITLWLADLPEQFR